ncbi:MAG: hypothetical protein JJ863_32835 [Deltaproteobacteria bacterium]|nr:hypothetical protein [Deltaproteobacteria bacterium]
MVRLLAIVLLLGCARPSTGAPVRSVPERGAVHSRATTAEADGVRVLWNGRVGRASDGSWLASTPRELGGLWRRIGADGDPPPVDFSTHVVLGTGFEDGPCQSEIVAAQVDAHGTLTFERQALTEACIALAVRVGVAVAVPRRILPESFVWVPRHSESDSTRRFERPPPGPVLERSEGESLARSELDAAYGTVMLPTAGAIGLRSLDDGRQIWVAHHADGTVAVVLADQRRDSGVSTPVRWDPQRGRFGTGHDSSGRSVSGGAPLVTLTHQVMGDRIAIGPPGSLGPGAIQPRELAPTAETGAQPYDELPLTAIDALPEGRIVRVEAELVYGIDGPPRVCTPPEHPKLKRYWLGCAETDLAYTGARAEERGGVTELHGPLAVRRSGEGIDLVVHLGGGMSGGVREHRIQPPAPRGGSRVRGAIAIGDEVTGDTRGAANGFDGTCVAAGGAPDEVWTLRADRPREVAFVLESEYDGALAVIGDDGEVRACNDDRHGHYYSSIVHVSLEAGETVRVVVDGFGGAAGAYRLHALSPTPPPNRGVLPLEQTVIGDTRGATDDQSSMCSAPGPDHALRFEVAEAGTYHVTIDAPGWAPLIALRDDGAEQVRSCRVGQDGVDDEYRLEPGTYWVIVDGTRDDAAGEYRIRAERAGD